MKRVVAYTKKIIKHIIQSFIISYRISKKFFVLKFVLLIISAFVPFLYAFVWKELLNSISKNVSNIVVLLISFIVFSIINSIKNSFDEYIQMNYNDAIMVYRDSKLIELYSKVSMSFFDSSSLNDKVNLAIEGYDALLNIIWCIFSISSAFIGLLISFIVITKFKAYLGILTILILVPQLLYNRKYIKKKRKLQESLEKDNRLCNYYSGVFSNLNHLMEIKINNSGEYFFSKHKAIWEKLFRINKKDDLIHNLKLAFLGLLELASDIIVIISSVFEATNKSIQIGDIQYNISMISNLRNNTNNLFNEIVNFYKCVDQIDYLVDFEKVAIDPNPNGIFLPRSKYPIIEFDNVTFFYPNNNIPTLKNCSFTLDMSRKNCLVGLNGSGKSTIVKLILGFYYPDKGRVLFDGVDIREYDVKEIRKLFGILFQESIQYGLKLREVIGLSDTKRINNDEQLLIACKESGFIDVIKDWDNKLDCYLGRSFVIDGKDLSGGQWQLLALSRMYFQNTSYIMLDEPSASLDPITEDFLFNKMFKLSKEKGCLMISHRLSNTILADSIYVLEEGTIIEQGNHKELIDLNGKYAKMFNIQAKRYGNINEKD